MRKEVRTHKIRLYPNKKQESLLKEHFGAARLAYNYGVERWKEIYQEHLLDPTNPYPSKYTIRNEFNKIKYSDYPFLKNVSKWATEGSFDDLSKAITAHKRRPKEVGEPKFRNKYKDNTYKVEDKDRIKINGKSVKPPRFKDSIKMAENVRFLNKPNAVVKQMIIYMKNNKYWVSFVCEYDIPDPIINKDNKVGIDLGINTLMTLSDGTTYGNPRVLKQYEKQLAHAQRALSRAKKGSKNRQKRKQEVSRIHEKIANVRRDNIHKVTTEITNTYDVVAVESLSVQKMMSNRNYAKSLADASFGTILLFLAYKAKLIKTAPPYFASSKTCSGCGNVKARLAITQRTYKCSACGLRLDRDLNAAINLNNYAS